MNYDPVKHHRRSIRLKGYDYSSAGSYFVTICVQHRACLFGEVNDGVMCINDAGEMVQRVWYSLPNRFERACLDTFVVMPNHIHGIIQLTDGEMERGCNTNSSDKKSDLLGNVVGAFKSITTHQYAIAVHAHHWQPFDKRLWQRNYYEHIIRDRNALQTVCQYIANNPSLWKYDRLHPNNPSKW